MKTALLIFGVMFLTGCGISSNYVKSASDEVTAKSPESVQLFYSPADVDFKYRELGRIFLKVHGYYAQRNEATQIEALRKEAAAKGGDAVIVLKDSHLNSSASMTEGLYLKKTDEVYSYSGIVIVKK